MAETIPGHAVAGSVKYLGLPFDLSHAKKKRLVCKALMEADLHLQLELRGLAH